MLMTEEYRALNAKLHEDNPEYGSFGAKARHKVRVLSQWGRLPILDWACGKATLAKSLGPAYMVTNYDPAIPAFAAPPEPHPVVVAGDCLEHIEPEFLDAAIAELWRLTVGKGLFIVHLRPAKKTLPDGRNTHLTVKPAEWWMDKLVRAGFRVIESHTDKGKPPMEATFVVERAY